MANLKDDPKVQSLLEKEAAKATKAETKRALTLIKERIDANKETEDKNVRAAVAGVLKSLAVSVRRPEAETEAA